MRAHDSELALETRGGLLPDRLDPADFFCGVTLFGALLSAMAGSLDAGLFLAGTFMALLILRQLELTARFELAFAFGIVIQGWGNALLLFERIGWYDKVVHFLTPLLVVPSIYLLLARAGALPAPQGNGLRRGNIGVLIISIALGIALATLWELVEGTSDRWLGTSLAHGYVETIDDLYSSLLGAIAAGAVLVWSAVPGGQEVNADPVANESAVQPE